MSKRKLDDEIAFAYYVGLGIERSHRAVARKFNVNRRAVGKASRRGNWMARLAKIEAEAQQQSDKKLTETRAEVRERHLKMIRAVASRGLMALQNHQLDDAMQGVKAIEAAIKLERIVMGEPSERVGLSIDELTRREVESFLATAEEPLDEDEY